MKKLTQGENFSKQNTTSNIKKMRKYFDIQYMLDKNKCLHRKRKR